jgi:hypothetical protein
MPQDRESGAEANRFGREYGEKIIAALGAKKVKRGSNECILPSAFHFTAPTKARKASVSLSFVYKVRSRFSGVGTGGRLLPRFAVAGA